MRPEPQDNSELKWAFPSELHNDALIAVEALPKNPYWWNSFTVQVNNESVSIPHRVYHNPASIKANKLSGLQKNLIDCMMSRNHDGFVRQENLARIVGSNYTWVPPFVVQLLGEYVVEIVRVIEANLENLDKPIYAQFLRANVNVLTVTEQRVISYWDCYYRSSFRKEDYPGFRVVSFFKQLVESKD
jgi:hypothetical protein